MAHDLLPVGSRQDGTSGEIAMLGSLRPVHTVSKGFINML